MTALSPARRESPVFTLVWYALVLAVVFTTAFWIGRLVGPDSGVTQLPPAEPHSGTGAH